MTNNADVEAGLFIALHRIHFGVPLRADTFRRSGFAVLLSLALTVAGLPCLEDARITGDAGRPGNGEYRQAGASRYNINTKPILDNQSKLACKVKPGVRNRAHNHPTPFEWNRGAPYGF